jgi:hypothetical protein
MNNFHFDIDLTRGIKWFRCWYLPMMPELTKVIAVVFGGLTVIVALWAATLAALGFPLF